MKTLPSGCNFEPTKEKIETSGCGFRARVRIKRSAGKWKADHKNSWYAEFLLSHGAQLSLCGRIKVIRKFRATKLTAQAPNAVTEIPYRDLQHGR